MTSSCERLPQVPFHATKSRAELLHLRKREVLDLNSHCFAGGRPKRIPAAAPFVPVDPNRPGTSYQQKFLPRTIFHDPDPLPGSRPRVLVSRGRFHSAAPVERLVKLQSPQRDRFLDTRVTDKLKPNCGTLEGPMYSSFAKDNCLRLTTPGHASARSTPSLGGTLSSFSNTLIR